MIRLNIFFTEKTGKQKIEQEIKKFNDDLDIIIKDINTFLNDEKNRIEIMEKKYQKKIAKSLDDINIEEELKKNDYTKIKDEMFNKVKLCLKKMERPIKMYFDNTISRAIELINKSKKIIINFTNKENCFFVKDLKEYMSENNEINITEVIYKEIIDSTNSTFNFLYYSGIIESIKSMFEDNSYLLSIKTIIINNYPTEIKDYLNIFIKKLNRYFDDVINKILFHKIFFSINYSFVSINQDKTYNEIKRLFEEKKNLIKKEKEKIDKILLLIKKET